MGLNSLIHVQVFFSKYIWLLRDPWVAESADVGWQVPRPTNCKIIGQALTGQRVSIPDQCPPPQAVEESAILSTSQATSRMLLKVRSMDQQHLNHLGAY